MRILVTGATGFLGRHLVRALAAHKHDIAILTRAGSDLSVLNGIELEALDTSTAPIAELLKGRAFDALIHCATAYGRRGESDFGVFDTNTRFALEVLEAAAAHSTPLFINADTALPQNANAYALSKKQFRDWGERYAEAGRIRFINIELEHFYGSGDSPTKFSTFLIRQCLDNVPEVKLTEGTQIRDFIHIDDVTAAFLLVLEKHANAEPAFENYSLGSGEGIAIRALAELIKELSGSETTFNFGAIPFRPNEAMRLVADPARLLKMGWKPQMSLRDGLKRTIEEERKS